MVWPREDNDVAEFEEKSFPEVVHRLYQKYITFQEVLNILASCWTLEKSLWSSHEVAMDLNLFDKTFRQSFLYQQQQM